MVLIPGIQGRWEWMVPTIEALSRTHRVLTFSLNDVSGPDVFDRWVAHIDALLDRAGEETATILGVSFGGLLATRYAAVRPARTSSLVIAVTPSPQLHQDPRIVRAIRHPWLALPVFAFGSVTRLGPEIVAAYDSWAKRAAFGASYATRAFRYPVSPTSMASWVRDWMALDVIAACRRISAPTLVITGEPQLDWVVPVDGTIEYVTLIRGAIHRTLPRTGHLGFLTKAHEFAAMVDEFEHSVSTQRAAGNF